MYEWTHSGIHWCEWLVLLSVILHEASPRTAWRRVGGISSGSAWLDSGLRGSVCLFDKKSSVRKENKQSSVQLLQSRRKSCYWSTTQYLDCRPDAHRHTLTVGSTHTCTRSGANRHWDVHTDTCTERKQVLGWKQNLKFSWTNNQQCGDCWLCASMHFSLFTARTNIHVHGPTVLLVQTFFY